MGSLQGLMPYFKRFSREESYRNCAQRTAATQDRHEMGGIDGATLFCAVIFKVLLGLSSLKIDIVNKTQTRNHSSILCSR